MVSIIGLFILVAVVVILAIIAYKLIYTYKLNKMIQDGEIKGRKLVDLSKMVMGAIIAGLVLYSGLLMYIIWDAAKQDNSVSRNNYAVIDVSDSDNYNYAGYSGSTELEDASFAKVYNKDANEGYSKEVIESGEYIFTVFKRNTPADSFHPDFLCFVEFAGADREAYACYSKAGFRSVAEETEGFYEGFGGDIADCLLYIGNLEEDCQFDITMSLLDNEAEIKYEEAMQDAYTEDKGDFPSAEDYAASVGTVSIGME